MNEVLQILRSHKNSLMGKYPINSLALFGSYSRGDQTPESDVDILVEMNKPDYSAFANLCYELEGIIRRKIDLVSKNGVTDRYMKFIEDDLIYV